MNVFTKILKFAKISKKKDLGRAGESAAAHYLRNSKKMKILRKNFRHGKFEVDIIALDGNCLVFVEVKARVEGSLVSGYYSATTPKKRSNIKRCAKKYISMLDKKPDFWRFDVVEVTHSKEGEILNISHFENLGL